ncbi:hypothetical protein ACTFIY_008854 [Dictyostelium cf. discoideum]
MINHILKIIKIKINIIKIIYFFIEVNEIKLVYKEFSIIKIQESIIKDYFKLNLIVINVEHSNYNGFEDSTLLEIHEYVSNENPEIISNLFKILELNHDLWFDEEVLVFNLREGEDEKTINIFKIFKGKNLIYDVYEDDENDSDSDSPTHINYSALFDPDHSGQQVESIMVKNENGNQEFVEAHHLIKVNQFENLHSITIPIDSFQILSHLSEETILYLIIY